MFVELGVNDPVAIQVARWIALVVHIMVHEYRDACFHRVHGVNNMDGTFCLGRMTLGIARRIGNGIVAFRIRIYAAARFD